MFCLAPGLVDLSIYTLRVLPLPFQNFELCADFDSLWKGYKREIVGKGWIDIHDEAIGRDEFKKNYDMAKKIAVDGDHVKILPVHEGKGIKGWKSADYLINANLWELESPNGSETSINNAIKGGKKQAPNIIIQVPKTADYNSVLYFINKRLKYYSKEVRRLILYHGNIEYNIK